MKPEKILNPDAEYQLPKPENLQEELLFELARVVSAWYKTQDLAYVGEYQAVYQALWEIGWDGGLDADMELPEELMPSEYLKATGRL